MAKTGLELYEYFYKKIVENCEEAINKRNKNNNQIFGLFCIDIFCCEENLQICKIIAPNEDFNALKNKSGDQQLLIISMPLNNLLKCTEKAQEGMTELIEKHLDALEVCTRVPVVILSKDSVDFFVFDTENMFELEIEKDENAN